MKPSFALDFRDGAVALLHRTSRGWQHVGAARFDAPDLAEALSYLRATALGLSPQGLATKLVIPNDQVLYTQIRAPGPEAAKRKRQIKAGLEGLTPYAVEDLVYDWSGTGPEIQVAAVARETLDEAEAFAVEHRFNPVSFVSAPDAGFFGEPFFGPTKLAATLLAPGEKVERDQAAIEVMAREFVHAEPTSPEAPPMVAFARPAAESVAESVAESAAAGAATEAATPYLANLDPVAPEAGSPDPRFSMRTDDAAREPDPLPDFRAATAPAANMPAFDPVALAVDLVDEAPMAVDVADDTSEPPQVAPKSVLPPKMEPLKAEPVLAEPIRMDTIRAAPPVTKPVPADVVEDVPASPAAEIIAAFATRRTAAMAVAVAAVKIEPVKSPTVGAAPVLRPSVPRPALARPAVPARDTGLRDAVPFPVKPASKPTLVAKGSKPAIVATSSMAGARRDRNVVALPTSGTAAQTLDDVVHPAPSRNKGATGLDGRPLPMRGKPRFLGLVLTGILLVILALVAAWSSYYLAFNTNSPPPVATSATATLAPAQPAPATPVATSVADLGPGDPNAPPATLPASPGDATAIDVPSPSDEALADGQDPALAANSAVETATTTPDPATVPPQSTIVQASALQSQADQSIAPDLGDQSAVAPADLTAQASPDAALPMLPTVSPVQSNALPAAPPALAAAENASVAPLASPRPEPAPGTEVTTDAVVATTPGNDPQDEIFLASADTSPLTPDPLTLPAPDAANDSPASAVPQPPPFGTVYTFDDQGRILPTKEGILTPEGVLLVAGKPRLVPPNRPVATTVAVTAPALTSVTAVAPALVVAPALGVALPPAVDASTAISVAAAPILSDPALAGKKPKARPAGLVAPTTTVKQGDSLSPAADTRFANVRPERRPEELVQVAFTPATESSAASSAAAGASLASGGIQPALSALALAVSPKPVARPGGLARAVDAAVAAAVRAPQPDASLQTASATVAPAAPEAQVEPDISTKAPDLPTSASVAKQATVRRGLNTQGLALIGVFGSSSARYAMIRQPGGGVKKIVVGDNIDGGRVAAITESGVQYQKGGRMVTLSMPTG